MTSINNFKTYSEKPIILLVVILFCLSLLEIGLRIMGWMPSNMTDGIFVQHGTSYRLGKNIEKLTQWPSFSYVTYTDSFGFRDKKYAERNINEKPYFVFLGASAVFGNGVNYEDSFVGIFADSLTEHGIEVLNLAVGGHNFADQEALFIDFTKNISRKPSKVFLCLNPLFIYNFDCKHQNIIVKNGYLLNEKAWRTGYIRLILGNISSAYCFIRNNIRTLHAKRIKSYVNIDSQYLLMYSKHGKMHDSNIIKHFEGYLQRFEQYCDQIGSTPIYVYIPVIDSFSLNKNLLKLGKDPGDYDVSFYEKFLERYCKDKKITFLNPKPILKDLYDKGIPLKFIQDAHYNQFANRAVGEYISNQIFLKEKID
jgi:hypothetical protein